MEADPPQLLVTGDLHLGQHPTHIPEEYDQHGFSPSSIWQSTVEEAVREKVDAVVLTGDVVDRENQFFEAYGALESGLRELGEANISVVAVAGNHDVETLPRLARELDLETFHLLGTGGKWERFTLRRGDEPLLHFDGWSYPTRHVRENPLEEYRLEDDERVPIIGLLHTELDNLRSRYAPVSLSDLRSTRRTAWLLGHVHWPGPHNEGEQPLVLYPGSPQPLDPTETGAHGPWLLEVPLDGPVRARQKPLATLRFVEHELDVSEAEDHYQVAPDVAEALRNELEQAAREGHHPDLLSARVTLTGRTPAHGDIRTHRGEIEDQIGLREEGVPLVVDTLRVRTKPPIDLESLAEGENMVAVLAGLILKLENGSLDDSGRSLLQQCHRVMQDAHAANAYEPLRGQDWVDHPERPDARDVLHRQAWTLLDVLLTQKEQHS